MNNPVSCPCKSNLAYEACCGRYHGGESAPDAEALMRSRYSAFVLCNEPYLLATWHRSTRPASTTFNPQHKWLGLRIVDVGTRQADAAEVEFIARYRVGGSSATRHHERSRFLLEGGRWFYVDGKVR